MTAFSVTFVQHSPFMVARLSIDELAIGSLSFKARGLQGRWRATGEPISTPLKSFTEEEWRIEVEQSLQAYVDPLTSALWISVLIAHLQAAADFLQEIKRASPTALRKTPVSVLEAFNKPIASTHEQSGEG